MTPHDRKRLLAGWRMRVRLPGGIGGFVYLAHDSFHFECWEGFGEGCTEAICSVDSSYLEDRFMAEATITRWDPPRVTA